MIGDGKRCRVDNSPDRRAMDWSHRMGDDERYDIGAWILDNQEHWRADR